MIKHHLAYRNAIFLAKNSTNIILQASYLPDLASCDFFLFPKLKLPLRGKFYVDKGYKKKFSEGTEGHDDREDLLITYFHQLTKSVEE